MNGMKVYKYPDQYYMIKNHFQERNGRGDFIEELIETWKQARISFSEKDSPKPDNSYEAMDELIQFTNSEYGRYEGFKIIIFTMRNRRLIQLRFTGKEEGRTIEQEREIKRKYAVDDYKGLTKCLNEWETQAKAGDLKKRFEKNGFDSLLELVYTHNNYKKELEIGAIIHLVRRLRQNSHLDFGVLQYTDEKLIYAWKLWEKVREQNKGEDTLSFMANDNKNLGDIILMQMYLNDGRRTISKFKEIKSLEGFQKKYHEMYLDAIKEPRDQKIHAVIYYWWTLRLKFRESQTKLDFKTSKKALEDIKNMKEDLTRIGNYSKVREYIVELETKKDESKNPDLYNNYTALHKSLVIIIENKELMEESLDEEKKGKNKLWDIKNKKLKELEKKYSKIDVKNLMAKIAMIDGTEKNLRKKPNLYKSPDNIKAIIENNRGDSLVNRVRNSILNARMMVDSVRISNSHMAAVTMLLISIDLIIKIRWFLSPEKINKTSKENKYASWLKRDDESLFYEFCESLINTLEEIRKAYEDYGMEKSESHKLIVEWIKQLNKISNPDLKQTRGGFTKLNDLVEECGKFIGWEWKQRKNDEGRKISEKDTLILYGGEGSSKIILKISSEEGSDCNPYNIPVGESKGL